MPVYQCRGEVPAKRHTQLRRAGLLLAEEVMGLEGFSGDESILYHLRQPLGYEPSEEWRAIERDEWVPGRHVHHHLRTQGLPPMGDPVLGRRTLVWNDDVEVALCHSSQPMPWFYRNGEGDEVVFVHQGQGVLATLFGDLPYRTGDYIVIPRGTTLRFEPEGPQRHLVISSPGPITIPRRYRNVSGQLLEHAPYYHRDCHPPGALRTHDEAGDFTLRVRIRGGLQSYRLRHHPFDVVGWDGFLYPWTLNIADFEPLAGRIHVPPPAHQTFEGRGFVVCSFCPRKLDWDPLAIPIPYYHANLNSEELIYYVSGSFGSRRGVEAGSITLHPSGLAHGPQPGLVEAALGRTETDELAVMCDTFQPLRFSGLAQELDDPGYAGSWGLAGA